MTGAYEGRNVVVTGGTGALGSAVVGRLLSLGASCHIPVFNADEGARFEYSGHARTHLSHGVDLTDEAAVSAFFDALPALWASVHIAGGFAMAPLADTTKDAFMGQVSMNALTCFLCSREAVKIMRRTGAQEGGRIVNVAARPGLEPRQGSGMAAYAASKAAVVAMTGALGEELASESIWVNAVAPSILDTPGNRAAMPDANHEDWPKVEEVAETIVHLASPENGAARGAVVPVYGKM
ncbi:MAG: SDR family NAD(P)-dependent oxidoreductase [Rhodospirillales bacterium]|nr:SDR family NAD(P)-dependent oxidoreductase [Rhodospirillales bacterium]